MRDERYEQQMLEAIGRQAKVDQATAKRFADRTQARLTQGGEEYGPENFLKIGADANCAEGQEEGLDSAAWAMLAIYCLNRDERAGEIDRDQAHHARYLLMQAASFGLLSWIAYSMARDVINPDQAPHS